jgi:nucleotide-binding universal stress UspA family protein
MVFERILVPLDASPVDDAVLAVVSDLAAELGSEVVLLRVAHYHTRDTKAHEVEDAEEHLAAAEARLRDKGFAVRVVVGHGEPAPAILAQAEEVGADLIAMATHGHGTLARMLMGSVANAVRHSTRVPLLLVKGGPADEKD